MPNDFTTSLQSDVVKLSTQSGCLMSFLMTLNISLRKVAICTLENKSQGFIF